MGNAGFISSTVLLRILTPMKGSGSASARHQVMESGTRGLEFRVGIWGFGAVAELRMELEPFGIIIYTGIVFLNCRPLHCRKWVLLGVISSSQEAV